MWPLRRRGRWTRLRDPRAASLAAGAAAGALVTFFADAHSGARRRALVRDRSAGLVRRAGRRTGRAGRVAGAYAVGWTKRLRHVREEPKSYDDATLAQKVQSEVFRPADAPKGDVNVNVVGGVVQLRGIVGRPELIDELVERVREVQGVKDVESFLHLPNTPAPIGR